MFTLYLWFVFAEHPFSLLLPPAFFSLLALLWVIFPTRDLGMRRSPPCGTIQFYPSDTARRRVPASISPESSARPGLVCHIRRRQATKIRSFCREDPSREARHVSASLTLIIFAERRLGSVDSWMCDWGFWFHYICTHGDMFSSVVSTD